VQDQAIEVQKLRQGYLELEQEAAKLGAERMDAMQAQMAMLKDKILSASAFDPNNIATLQGMMEQQLSGIQALLVGQQSHQQNMIRMAEQLMRE